MVLYIPMAFQKNNLKNITQEQKITQTLEENYLPYAMSVIVSRAIPEIDGFKPSHRKLLYTMYLMNLLNGERTKSSNVVGQTMKLNPHGDGAIYETLVRLTEGNSALLSPFIDSKGNFGKQFSRDMAYAAPRYTEVKLGTICNEVFKDIDKNTVDFVDNYDGMLKEPTLLPTTFPNILANPNLGIAVGMASSICSFNLSELCEATITYMKTPDIDLLDVLPAPDFPTGGKLIYSRKELAQIYETGRGSFKLCAKYNYDQKNSCIDITEIPYTTNIESIVDKILSLVKLNKIRDITDVRDETDLKGLKITIDIKKNTDPDLLMRKLFQLTPLSDSFSCNFNLLIHGRPMTLGIRDILKYWVEFRMESISRQLQFDIEKKSQKHHLLRGLSTILDDIDKTISIIRNTEQESDVITNLMNGFDIDKVQSEYIADMKLRNINREYIVRRTQELETLALEIENLQDILNSPSKIKLLIAKQLRFVSKKYGKPRRTELIQEEEIIKITKEDLIEDYPIRLFLTKENYFKKISASSLRGANEQKLKEEDSIIQEIESTNRSEILFFSNMHNVYKMKAHDLLDTKASILGDYLPNLLGMEENEEILYMVSTLDYSGFMLFFFENGRVSKVPLEYYMTKTNRKKLTSAYYTRSPIVTMKKRNMDTEFLLLSHAKKALLIHSDSIPISNTKSANGIPIMTFKKNDKLTGVANNMALHSINAKSYKASELPAFGMAIKKDHKLILSQS